jgi:hypothetical protein
MMASIEIGAYKPNMEVVFFGSALSLLFRQSQQANQADRFIRSDYLQFVFI